MLLRSKYQSIDELKTAWEECDGIAQALEQACQVLLSVFACDRVCIKFRDAESLAPVTYTHPEFKRYQSSILVRKDRLELKNIAIPVPLFIHDLQRSRRSELLLEHFSQMQVKSLAVVGLWKSDVLVGCLELHFCQNYHHWRSQELEALMHLCDDIALLPERFDPSISEQTTAEESVEKLDSFRCYERLADQGKLLILRLDSNMALTEILGDIASFGFTRESLLEEPGNIWKKLLLREAFSAKSAM